MAYCQQFFGLQVVGLPEECSGKGRHGIFVALALQISQTEIHVYLWIARIQRQGLTVSLDRIFKLPEPRVDDSEV